MLINKKSTTTRKYTVSIDLITVREPVFQKTHGGIAMLTQFQHNKTKKKLNISLVYCSICNVNKIVVQTFQLVMLKKFSWLFSVVIMYK